MKYAISTGNAGTAQAMTTTYKTLISVTAATGATTLRRGLIDYVGVGTDGTPSDVSITYKLDRQTTVGTGTAATPAPRDTGDAAALLVYTVNHTAEPTVTAATQLLEVPYNMRQTFQWWAPPNGELIIPAVNVAGIGLRAKSPSYTGTCAGTLHVTE